MIEEIFTVREGYYAVMKYCHSLIPMQAFPLSSSSGKWENLAKPPLESFIDQSFSVIVVSLNEPHTVCSLYNVVHLYVLVLQARPIYLFNNLVSCIYKLHVCPNAPYNLVQSAEVDLVCETMHVCTILAMKIATCMW